VILANAPRTIKKIDRALEEHFPYGPGELSKVERVFEAEHSLVMGSLDGTNTMTSTMIEKSVDAFRDLASTGIAHVRSMEHYILLKTPPLKNDDNRGVHKGVHKFLKEVREGWSKNLEAIPVYYSLRANSIDKLNLASTKNVETTTETEAFPSNEGNRNNKSKVVVREKKVEAGDISHSWYRQKYVLSLDVQFYADLQMAMTDLLYGYITVMTTMEKNWDLLIESKVVRGYK